MIKLPLFENRFSFCDMSKAQIKVKMTIEGDALDVINDFAISRPSRTDALATITMRVKAAEGKWLEYYDLPIINGLNTTKAVNILDGLYKQGRITNEQYKEAQVIIDKLSRFTNEVGYKSDRYEHTGVND